MKEVLYCDNRGQLFTYQEAREIFRNKYDGEDPLNGIPFDEYFTRVIFQDWIKYWNQNLRGQNEQ